MSAFQQTKRAFFFAAENGAYRYWYGQQILKLQIKADQLAKFRQSEVGRRLERFIDLFAIGGGWYEVRGIESNAFARFGVQTDGLKMWVRAINEFFLHKVNGNQPKVEVQYVRRVEHHTLTAAPVNQAKLDALVNKFGRNGWGR